MADMTDRLSQLRLPADAPGASAADVISARTRSLMFSAVLSRAPISRTQLAKQTGLSPSTVTKVIAPLIEAGYLVEVGTERPGKGAGRPQRMLAVNHERYVVVGLKLAPDLVSGVLTDMGSRVVAVADRPLPDHSLTPTLDAAVAVFEQLRAQRPDVPVMGVGVAVGGHVADGVLVHSGVMGWDDVDIAGLLAKRLDLPTVVNNDLNALTIAERWFGKGRDVDSFAVVTVGAGVGCGLVLGGELFTGATGLAGELGHLPLFPDGPDCSCGNSGCLEAIASSGGVMRMIRERSDARCESIADAVRLGRDDHGPDGDVAREAFTRAGDALGRGLAVLCNVVNPERIILSGEGVVAHDLFGPAMRSALHAHGFSSAATDCELVVDAVDAYLWAHGAASLVIDGMLRAVDAPNGASAASGRR